MAFTVQGPVRRGHWTTPRSLLGESDLHIQIAGDEFDIFRTGQPHNDPCHPDAVLAEAQFRSGNKHTRSPSRQIDACASRCDSPGASLALNRVPFGVNEPKSSTHVAVTVPSACSPSSPSCRWSNSITSLLTFRTTTSGTTTADWISFFGLTRMPA